MLYSLIRKKIKNQKNDLRGKGVITTGSILSNIIKVSAVYSAGRLKLDTTS